MFKVQVSLPKKDVTGLDALDLRRRLKLPDGTTFRYLDDRSLYADVSEGFARAWFTDRTATCPEVYVKFDDLQPGDLADNGTEIELSADVPPERIVELWLVGRSRR